MNERAEAAGRLLGEIPRLAERVDHLDRELPVAKALEQQIRQSSRAVRDVQEILAEVIEAIGPHRVIGGAETWANLQYRLSKLREVSQSKVDG